METLEIQNYWQQFSYKSILDKFCSLNKCKINHNFIQSQYQPLILHLMLSYTVINQL